MSMGSSLRGEATTSAPTRQEGPLRRASLAATLALLAISACLPASAQASFHLIDVREVYPGSAAAPESSYVELQMYEGGQSLVNGHGVTLYGSTGTSLGTLSFGSDLGGSPGSQRTILVGDTGVQAAFGVTPDLSDAGFNIPASGGAACWAGSIDCVAWGNFSGSTPSPVGTPVDGSGIPDGMAVRRSISGGTCTNLLDAGDDTDDSAGDFSDATPAPQSYGTVSTPPACTAPPSPPSAIIDTKPANPTKTTSAAFSFHSSPAGATFECKLDLGSFGACDSGTVSYPGPLSEAGHAFQVKATNGNGTGSPASYNWTIDLTAPIATIDSHPVDPGPGGSAVFKYHANEVGSTFQCSLAKGAASDSFSSCASTGKTYSGLDDGTYMFKVRAIDKATNQGDPASYTWEVDNSLEDTTPPDTVIDSKPPNPSDSSTAVFTYHSTELGSTFECRLDGSPFTGCAATGATYNGLADGPHSFQVKAKDASGNADPYPAGYSFEIVTMQLVPASLPAMDPPARPRPPETKLSARVRAKTRDRTPTVRFRSDTTGARFECSVDRRRFRACRSPFTAPRLSPGRHRIRVRATAAGLIDPTPAVSAFKVISRKSRKQRRKSRRRRSGPRHTSHSHRG
jgi:large repetitive protein